MPVKSPNHRRGLLGVACALLLFGGKIASPAIVQDTLKQEIKAPQNLEKARQLIKDGKYAEAETLARELLKQAEAALGADSLKTAEVLDVLVESLFRGGKARQPESRKLAERAIEIKQKLLGPDHPEVAKSLYNLAALLLQLPDYAGAKPLFERALAIREKALGPDHPDVAQSLNGLGALLGRTNDYAGARSLYERALTIREKILEPDHRDVAQSLYNLADLLWRMGDYAKARPLCERVLAIDEKVLGPEHPNVATDLNLLAILLKNMGDYAGARPLYERALTIYEKAYGPESSTVGMSLSNFANLLRETGDYTGARPLYERAIAIYEKANDPGMAHSLRHLGELLQHTGDYAGARALYERALVIWEKAGGPDSPRVAEALNHLANLLRDTGDYAGARPLYERALTIREKALGPDHPEVAETLNHFAQLLAEIGDPGGALQAALRAEQIGRDHLHLTARGLAEREALRYASVRATGLDLALSLTAAVGTEFSEARRQVWDALIRSRALVLDEMAGRHRTVAEATQITQLAQALTSAYQRLANLIVRGRPGDGPPEHYRRLLDEARQEKEQAERALAAQSTRFRQEQSRSRIGFSEVAAALSPNSALVAFAHYDRHTSAKKESASASRKTGVAETVSSYLALVLRSGEVEPAVIPLGTAKEIETLIARWSEEAARGVMVTKRSPKQTEAAYRKAGEALRRKIWDPVASRLQGAKRIFVVPDGALNLVSLAALPVDQSDYIAEADILIHYLSAERDLVPSEAPAIKGEGLLALGGPSFDETTLFAALNAKDRKSTASGEALAMASRYRGERSNCGDFQSMRFEPLPASEHEVRELVSLWMKGSGTATVIDLTGAAASEAAFKEQASGRRVLHLATHGFFLAGRCPSALASARGVGGVKAVAQDEPPPVTGDNPLLLSGLALAGANHRAKAGPEEDDGILTAEEIAAMNLSGVEWAVLSACETGVGKVEAGEGVFGLRRAFQMAGAGTLIMSLWSVEDESARQWMRALYEGRLVKKLSTAESVRAASLEVLRSRREKGQSTHPFFWAGFVAAGDWR